MATSSSLLSEEQFMCSICLSVFTEPVSTSCGHNFCKACLTMHWDSNKVCQCPLCKEEFSRRPELRVNTFISEMADQIRKSFEVTSIANQCSAKPGEVSCDICNGTKLKAWKSCLVCQISYCETHLEPHKRVAALKRHKMIDPQDNLEDRICKKHERLLEVFCRTDQTCVCQFCTETDHKTHDTVPLEEECRKQKTQLKSITSELQNLIKERLEKIKEINCSIELSKRDAERQISDIVQVLTALVHSIKINQTELIEVIEKQHKADERQAEALIIELEQEITELNKRGTELEQLLHTEDHLHVLQSFSSACTFPPTNDWSEISVHSDLYASTVRRAVSQLKETLNKDMERGMKIFCDAELIMVQQYAVDVTLDPDSAHPELILSEDKKQVRTGDKRQNVPDNAERFNICINVLGKNCFFTGRYYYEVMVKGKTKWDLGVARQSIKRKGNITVSPENGYWTVRLRHGRTYSASTSPPIPLSLRDKPQKVGVFVDYEGGQVSFYNVEASSHIYSFTDCTFTEKLHPYFSPCLNAGGKNSAPLIISPVSHTD